ncbi:sugar phosphate isomerase/epimerase family protein [Streptomyces coeruleorubidus]|uniref:Sugar phosphate isomerase/epimerase n=1 Tax=Streptomyces coeruleorubidus TaxID=116188 RepID=A0ABZ0KMQ6_STRC4|nr:MULTISPECIES: sugar phosphate isomerase/epimerase [Streptomyces]WOT39080.1 sugar phosphate isomerase/epimerase [Streptomyces coeruleorubidus]GGU41574.1 xylose isomerase [Streptomyces bellus]
MSRKARLSVQLYSVREALTSDLAGTLARIADLGYRHVEPFGFGRWNATPAERVERARELRAALDAAGLTVSSVHAALSDGNLAPLAEECRVLGTDTVFVPVPELVEGFERNVFGDADHVSAFAARLTAASEELAGHGINLGYHNHEFEWTKLPDGRAGYDVFWELAGERLLAELDVYWATAAGQDPVAVLTQLGRRAVAVHLKDGPVGHGEPQTPIGTGDVHIPALLAAGEHLAWHIAEIDTTELDVFDLLESNRTAILDLGRTVG